MKIESFQDLTLWKASVVVAKQIYTVTNNNLFIKDYGLRDQMRRAIVSVSSNIAEGFEKNNNNEFIRYLKIVKGSIGELKSQLIVSKEIGYIANAEFERLYEQLNDLAKQSGGFITYLTKFRKRGSVATKTKSLH